jgi:hypothetical protein
MTSVGDALELIHTSPDRWRVVRCEGYGWRHGPRSVEAFTAAQGGRTPLVSRRSDGERLEETEEEWKLWFEKPSRTRAEFTVGSEVWSAVTVGSTWWSWSPTRGGRTNGGWEGSELGIGPGGSLLDVGPLLPVVELALVEDVMFLQRRAFHVRAVDRPIDDPHVAERLGLHGLPSGADEYGLLIDAERGVALRIEQRRSGLPFHVLEMTSVAFDESLPTETFLPPGGPDIEYSIEPASRSMLLDEAVRQIPFAVLVPEHPEVGPPRAMVQFGSGAPQLHLTYSTAPPTRGDNRNFVVWEAAEPLPELPRWRWREVDGVRIVEDATTEPSTRRVRLERGSTRVDISSTTIPEERLIELARSLVPLRDQPPRLVET